MKLRCERGSVISDLFQTYTTRHDGFQSPELLWVIQARLMVICTTPDADVGRRAGPNRQNRDAMITHCCVAE